MIGHQREVLTALGIDLWVPKEIVCQQNAPTLLWRDQATPEVFAEIVVAPKITTTTKNNTLKQPITIEPTRQIVTQPNIEDSKNVLLNLSEPPTQLEAFSLQALSLDTCILVVNATQLTAEQQLLWANIQRAVSTEFYELNWPFAWGNMQNGRGAESYIRGFIDVMLQEKHLLFLGEIPHIQHEQAMILASLQEMLEQPLLKKRLWQFMREHRVAINE